MIVLYKNSENKGADLCLCFRISKKAVSHHISQILAPFGVLPMVPFVILPMVPLVANGTIGLPMVPIVPFGEPMVPLTLPLVQMVLPMVPLVKP